MLCERCGRLISGSRELASQIHSVFSLFLDSQPTGDEESSDNLKSFKVSLEDPAWKVLPAALRKYKINNDDWQNYAMFICYGSTGASS